LLVGGFAAAILVGALLLTLPLSSSGARIGLLDALFTAAAFDRPTNHRSTSLEGYRMEEPARVAVLGLGDFGYHLACELYQLGHEVLAVDSNQDKVQQILPYVTKAAVADRTIAETDVLILAGHIDQLRECGG
jgi:glutamate dehydrogenase/leucine dehydrogenase